jgi:hypothetical protein
MEDLMKAGLTALAAAMFLGGAVVSPAETLKIGFLDYVTSAKRKIFEDHAGRQAPKCPM